MQIGLDPRIALPIAAIALATSIGIWYYFLRPVPELQQLGTIEKVEFFAKERVEKNELRNLRNADDLVKRSHYTLPNRFIYTIKLDDGKSARYQENAHNSKSKPEHSVGEKITITYTIREFPFGKAKILVLNIK